MRIIKFIILITFLFNSTAYPGQNVSNTLRPNLMTDSETGVQRFLDTTEQVILVNREAKKKKSGIHNYKPGWTFEAWKYAKKAIERRFETTEEREEALRLVRNLATRLADDKRIDPAHTLQYIIPAIANAVKNTDELEELLPFIEELTVKLADKEIYPTDTLGYGIPIIAKIAKNIDELKLFIDFAIRLADKKIDPTYTLQYGIPAIADTAKNIDELKLFIDFAIRLTYKGIYPVYALQYSIPVIANLAKNMDELEKTLLSIHDLAIRFADKGIHSRYTLQYGIPAIANAVKNTDELEELLPFIEELTVKLADKEIYPTDTLEYGIPAIDGTAKNIDELKVFLDLAIKLADNRIDPAYALQHIIPAITESAKTPQELKDICDILFDLNIKLAKNNPRLLHLVISAISHGDVTRALELKKNYGDIYVRYTLREAEVIPPHQEYLPIGQNRVLVHSGGKNIQDGNGRVSVNWDNKSHNGHDVLGEKAEQIVSSIDIYPLSHFTQLTVTPVLFVDIEIVKNPAGFKEALKQLRNNEGNVVVVLLTQETKGSVIAKLEGIDLIGVQFRTQAELGLEDLKWGEDNRVSLIDGINSLKCVPLTMPLCDTFKDLQNARSRLGFRNSSESEYFKVLASKLSYAGEDFFYYDSALRGWTIIAGSPNFDPRNPFAPWVNWGRDTMISLPDLTLPDKPGLFRAILVNYIRFVRNGLLPNYLGNGDNPNYNSVDATMFMFWAVSEYLKYTGDTDFLKTEINLKFSEAGKEKITILEVLEDIVEKWQRGVVNRDNDGIEFKVFMDNDSLISAGNGNTSLTWMDAREGGRPVTSRYGKPVEVNALWINALRLMADVTKNDKYRSLAQKAEVSFADKFWNQDKKCLYDTVEGDSSQGEKIRPNQVIAVAFGLFDLEKSKLIMETVTEELLTPYGLRTLSQDDSEYHAQRREDTMQSAYHNGTVWPWLTGFWGKAYAHAYGNEETIKVLEEKKYFKGLNKQLNELNSIAEIYNGECELDHGYNATGCPIQAWSVAQNRGLMRTLFPELLVDKDTKGSGIIYEMSIRDYYDIETSTPGLKTALDELEFLKEAGVEYVYLLGVIKNSGQPFEILDPFDIDFHAGSFEDLDRFIKKAKRLGIKVMLDWMANQHLSKESPYCKFDPDQAEKYHPDWFLYTNASDGNVFNEEGARVMRGREVSSQGIEFGGMLQDLLGSDESLLQGGKISIDDPITKKPVHFIFRRADANLRKITNSIDPYHQSFIVSDGNAVFLVSATDEQSLSVPYPRRWGSLAQPDLSHPRVREQAIEIGKFWLEKGISGFRVDAAFSSMPERVKNNWGVDIQSNLSEEFTREMRKINPETFFIFEGFNIEGRKGLLRLADYNNAGVYSWEVRDSGAAAFSDAYGASNMDWLLGFLNGLLRTPELERSRTARIGPEHDSFNFQDPPARLSYTDKMLLYSMYLFLPGPVLIFNGQIYGLDHVYKNLAEESHPIPRIEQARPENIRAGQRLFSLRRNSPQLINGGFLILQTGAYGPVCLARFDEKAAVICLINPTEDSHQTTLSMEPFISLLNEKKGAGYIVETSLLQMNEELNLATWRDLPKEKLGLETLSVSISPKSCKFIKISPEKLQTGRNHKKAYNFREQRSML